MGKKRSREEAKDVPPADGGADRMDEDSSDDEVR
jgi:protein BCP1